MSNKDEAPKVSPFSMSVWQDLENPNQWNWTVHIGTRVSTSGRATDYNVAANQARDAMGKVVK